MARIRTIKPEFWDSPGTAQASYKARLFFIALWNWADDYGKGTASPKQLIGFAFPNDHDVTVADYPSLASELHSAFEVVFYEVDGRPYYLIPKFQKHQRTEKKAASRIPDPPTDEPAGQSPIDEPSVDSGGPSDAAEGGSVTGTGEQGNRGTGEVVILAPRGADPKLPRASIKGTRIPDPFTVDEAMKDWAIERRMDPQWVLRQTERFINYWTAVAGAKGVKTDWRATWRNWLLKAQDDAPAAGPAPTNGYARDDVRGRFK